MKRLYRIFQNLTWQQIRDAALFIVPFCVVFFLLSYYLDEETAKTWVETAGIWGPVIYMIYLVISHVFAPLTVLPVMILMIGLYGPWLAILFTFIAEMVGAAVCFTLARRYGPVVVRRLSGEGTLTTVQKYLDVIDVPMFRVMRLVGIGIFDTMSYTMGLTHMDFWTYIRITFVWTPPSLIILALCFTFGLPDVVATILGAAMMFVGAGIIGWMVHKKKQKKIEDGV